MAEFSESGLSGVVAVTRLARFALIGVGQFRFRAQPRRAARFVKRFYGDLGLFLSFVRTAVLIQLYGLRERGEPRSELGRAGSCKYIFQPRVAVASGQFSRQSIESRALGLSLGPGRIPPE